MATRRAVANGNWSATGTWNGGVVPTNGDTVYANGFNVTIDQNVNIGGANNPIVNTGSLVSGQWYQIVNVGGQTWTSIGAASNTAGAVFQSTGTGTAGNGGTARALATLTTASNTAAGATTGGGNFLMSTIFSINTDLRSGTTICFDVSASTGTLTLDGLNIAGGSATNAFGFRNNNPAIINIANCNLIPGGGTQSDPVRNASSGTINISNSVINGGNSNNPAASGVSITGTGGCNITSSTITAGAAGFAVQNASNSGTITISGCTLNGAAFRCVGNEAAGTITVNSSTLNAGTGVNTPAINNLSVGTITCTDCTFTASAFCSAVTGANVNANVNLSGSFLDHWQGYPAVYVFRWKLGTTPVAAQHRMPLAGTADSYVTFFTADNAGFGLPAANHVRSGISYGGGAVTGICAVPAAGSVALGVPVDAGYGTAVLTPAALREELATELARLDAPVSAAGNAPSAAQNAAAVWGAATKEITGGTVTTLTNAPSVPSAATIASQVRTELAAELARVDQNISSRLASSAYTAPANSDIAAIKSKTDNLPASPAATGDIPSANITAIKAKTDLLVTDRLAQCSTVATTGAQLAAALS